MNFSIKPISQFVNKVKNKLKQRAGDRRKARENFKNRKDNTNYYKGTDYWKDNTN